MCVIVFTVCCIVCTVFLYCFAYVYVFLLVFLYCHRVTTQLQLVIIIIIIIIITLSEYVESPSEMLVMLTIWTYQDEPTVT
jgi:hypothetical protein